MTNLNDHISKLRHDFSKHSLDEKDADKDPFKQFEKWYKDASDAEVAQPHALTLSTVDPSGRPSSRILYLRHFSNEGFIFYTNYHSKKGKDIEQNPFAAMNFFWSELERQVRVEGELKKISEKKSDAYFSSRPRESQLGAWVSQQSTLLKSREEMEEKFKELENKYEGKTVPRPPHWGGYILVPVLFEFWQGRPGRLHDRLRYCLDNNKWKIERLFP